MASEKLQEIKTLFAQKLGMKTVDETKSLKDLGLDSLDVVELSFDLEDRYGISLDPEKLSTIKTVADLYAEIEKKLTREHQTELQNEIDDIKELRDEYFAFIEARNLRDSNTAAEEFITYKDEQLLAAIEEGNV